jgi:hypothetical protein
VPHAIRVTLTDEAFIALQATAVREQLNAEHTDVVNRAIIQYGIGSALPPGKTAEISHPDGSVITLTRRPTA